MPVDEIEKETRLVFLLPSEDNKATGEHDAYEAFHVVKPLFTSNGIEVGEPMMTEEGFTFAVHPVDGEWNRVSINAFTAGLHSLSALGFTVYSATVFPGESIDEEDSCHAAGFAVLAGGVAAVAAAVLGLKKLFSLKR